jgi:hypothetical protein
LPARRLWQGLIVTSVTVTIDIRSSSERMWEALTTPEQVAERDGAVPLSIPDSYPAPEQLTLWRIRIGPLSAILKDRIDIVEEAHAWC